MTFQLRTDRLLLREWRDEDLDAFAQLNADPVVMEHLPSALTRAESDSLAGRIRGAMGERGFGFWAVEVVGEARFVGFVGLSVPSFDPPFASESPCVEIGWRLSRAAWGRGLATEGARAALAHGFDVIGLEEIVAFTTPANTRSRRVMEKAGMTRRPEDDFDHPRVQAGHPLRRHVLYRSRRKT